MENELKRDYYILALGEYLETLSNYFEKIPIDTESPDLLLRQILELGKAIKLLLEEGYVWQSQILKRTLKESVILTFVIVSLRERTQRAYFAIYKLQGWYEVLDIFEKLGFEKHKKGKWPELIEKRMKKLKKLILEEFKSSEDEVMSDKNFKKYVRNKLSRDIYEDAKIIAQRKYRDFPEIQNAIYKLLKEGGLYQAESNFVHSRYFSAVLMVKEYKKSLVRDKRAVVRDTVSGIHLALTVYAVDKDSMVPLLDKLTEIARKIPKVFG